MLHVVNRAEAGEWHDPDLLKDNPFTWMLLIDGLPVDVRMLPVEFQRKAFDTGLIPFLPGEEATDERQ